MSNSSRKTPIQMPSVAEDRKITAAAKADPDTQPLTKAQLAQMVPTKALPGAGCVAMPDGSGSAPNVQPRSSLHEPHP